MKTTEQAVLYARVSSKEQAEEGFSIPAQRQLLRSYAKREHLTIAVEFSDDETAKSTGRTGFGNMLKFLTEHPNVRTLLVEKVDRLTRNFEDYGALKRLGLTIHFVKEGTVLHPQAHSSVRLFTGMRVLMAEHYVENLSEEVKKGMHEKAAEGGWPTWAPLGYRNVRRPEGIEPDPEKAPLIIELFEATASGAYSLHDLTKLAKRIGLRGRRGKHVAKSNISILLQNPVYTGTFRWGGKTYRGKYEPLISETLFTEVQDVLSGRSRPRGQKRTFTFTGLARCATCNGLLTGDLKKGQYVYYACRGRLGCKRFYPERAFEETTVRALESLRIDDAISEWIETELGHWFDDLATRDESKTRQLQKRRTDLQRLLSASYEEKLLGRIDEETWRGHDARWKAEIGELDAAIEAQAPSMTREEFLARVRTPLELVQTAAAQYLRQTEEERARLLKTVCSNYTASDGSITLQMRSPFDALAKAAESGDWLGDRESNPDSSVQSRLSYH
jgi:site-specific DNA recombinase